MKVLNTIWGVLTKIFSSKIFWYAAAGITGFLLLKKYVFKQNAVPEVLGYSPALALPDQSDSFKTWIRTTGQIMVDKLGSYLSTWHLTNGTLNDYILEIEKYNDNQLIYIINGYNQLYYSNNKGSLAKDLEDISYYTPLFTIRDNLVKRIRTLELKYSKQ